MSAVTPDIITQEIYKSAQGLTSGPIVTLAEWKKYYSDLDGCFMYWGRLVNMSLVKVGGGIYRIKGDFA